MMKIFESVMGKKPKYSAFDLSREQKLSMELGTLVPTICDEVVPGDEFKVKSEMMMRFAPMLAPVMHRVDAYMHYFFVPNRLLWNQWEEFITGGKNGTSEPVFPKLPYDTIMNNSALADYLGIPQGVTPVVGSSINALPFRAYQLIFNQYYRDETLQNEVDITSSSNTIMCALQRRAWEKDYFTSALPFPQRGDAVGVPVDLEYKTPGQAIFSGDLPGGDTPVYTDSIGRIKAEGAAPGEYLNVENLQSTELSFTINELRKSSALQRFLERQATGGYRYIETILSQFGVRNEDYRLQRAEYLGGGKQPVIISEVLNTTGTEEAPQGQMAGHGISVGQINSFKKRFTEHGWVIGILSVIPKTAYQQGLHRKWNRFDRFDYYWPEFADLGEQEILNKEIYFQDQSTGADNETWGYQQRYAEYKYGCSTVHGDFRNSLDFWHMGRIFSSLPPLNEAFIRSNPTNRIFAVTDPGNQNLWVQIYHDVKARRPMPYFANPKLT